MKEHSIWSEEIKNNEFLSLKDNIKTEVLIIGGGITGILCAYELKKRNIDYVLVEKDRIGNNITKNTTAFISAQHETLYQDIAKDKGIDKALEYLNLNLNAINEYKKINETYDIEFEECCSVLYTTKDENIIYREKSILDKMGYPTKIIDKIPLPIHIKKGILFYNQATIHPLKCINSLSKELNIYEKTKIIKIIKNKAYTETNEISFRKLIIATHYPIINKKGFYFMKLFQRRSYVVAIKDNMNIKDTYCSIDEDGLYFRSYKNHLIVGGNDRDTKTVCNKALIQRVQEIFKNKEIEYKWSNQDCISIDGIPYIGRHSLMHKNWFVSTGYNMWGFTWAMSASKIIADMIEGKKTTTLTNPQRFIIKKKLFSNILNSVKNLVNLKKTRCSHLGCALHYNETDGVWECPCHGSRFDIAGKVIDGPATKDINL